MSDRCKICFIVRQNRHRKMKGGGRKEEGGRERVKRFTHHTGSSILTRTWGTLINLSLTVTASVACHTNTNVPCTSHNILTRCVIVAGRGHAVINVYWTVGTKETLWTVTYVPVDAWLQVGGTWRLYWVGGGKTILRVGGRRRKQKGEKRRTVWYWHFAHSCTGQQLMGMCHQILLEYEATVFHWESSKKTSDGWSHENANA